MEEDPLQLQDLVPAEPLLRDPGLPPWAWLAIAAGAVAVLVLVVFLLRRRRRPGPPPLPDPNKAFQAASDAIGRAAALPCREAATASSEAIRRYLAATCHDPSLYETHEEYLARHQALDRFPLDVRELTSTLFCRLAELKYDRDRNGSTPEMIEGSLHVLGQLHQHRPA